MSFSRRHRVVRAKDDALDLKIDITADFKDGNLTRDERDLLIESATSRVMEMIPGLRFVYVPLSKLKVTR